MFAQISSRQMPPFSISQKRDHFVQSLKKKERETIFNSKRKLIAMQLPLNTILESLRDAVQIGNKKIATQQMQKLLKIPLIHCEQLHGNIINIAVDILARTDLNEYMSLHNDALTILIQLSYRSEMNDGLFQAIPSYLSLLLSYFYYNNPASRVLIDKILILIGNLTTQEKIIPYSEQVLNTLMMLFMKSTYKEMINQSLWVLQNLILTMEMQPIMKNRMIQELIRSGSLQNAMELLQNRLPINSETNLTILWIMLELSRVSSIEYFPTELVFDDPQELIHIKLQTWANLTGFQRIPTHFSAQILFEFLQKSQDYLKNIKEILIVFSNMVLLQNCDKSIIQCLILNFIQSHPIDCIYLLFNFVQQNTFEFNNSEEFDRVMTIVQQIPDENIRERLLNMKFRIL